MFWWCPRPKASTRERRGGRGQSGARHDDLRLRRRRQRHPFCRRALRLSAGLEGVHVPSVARRKPRPSPRRGRSRHIRCLVCPTPAPARTICASAGPDAVTMRWICSTCAPARRRGCRCRPSIPSGESACLRRAHSAQCGALRGLGRDRHAGRAVEPGSPDWRCGPTTWPRRGAAMRSSRTGNGRLRIGYFHIGRLERGIIAVNDRPRARR